MSWSSPPVLQAGERLRFEDGSIWRVERVTGCSASIRCVGGLRQGTRSVEFADGRNVDFADYQGHRPGQRLDVSPRSIVERIRSVS